jgi:hypothetical protein
MTKGQELLIELTLKAALTRRYLDRLKRQVKRL